MSHSSLSLLKDLAQWYCRTAREFPWRKPENQHDPYRVLVSEVMLQQTTVATVYPRYEEFLQRFPTLNVLSEASVDEVLAQWQGLGYYNRARNLHATARYIEEHCDGVFPRDYQKVLSLPGIGRYTAGAVCSLAFETPVPAVDVNVERVLSRLFVVKEPVKSASAQNRLWAIATRLVEEAAQHAIAPSLWNSALIELGGTICTKRLPLCDVCPMQQYCGAFAANMQYQLPRTPPRRTAEERHDVCLFITQNENSHTKVLLQRCGAEGAQKKTGNWWHGMWQLPRATCAKNQSAKMAASQLLHGEMKMSGAVNQHLKTLHHTVTHHKIQLDCFAVDIPPASDYCQNGNTLKSTFVWHTHEEIEKLAMPSVMRKLVNQLLAPNEGGLLALMQRGQSHKCTRE